MSASTGPGLVLHPGFSRRRFIGGAVAAAGLTLLSACAGPAPTPTPQPAAPAAPTPPPAAKPAEPTPAAAKVPAKASEVELVWSSWATDTYGMDREQRRIDLYRTLYPDSPIKLNMRNIGQNYRDQILTQLAGGVGPDVFRLGWEDVYPFMEQGQIPELEPLFKTHPKNWLARPDLKKKIVDGARYRGKLYAAPMAPDMSMIFINRTIFETVGVPQPPNSYKEAKYETGWTFDHVLEAAKKLTVRKGDGPPESFGIDVMVATQDSTALVESFGGRTISDDWTQFLWHEEPATRAWQWSADLRLVHKVAATQAEVQGGAFTFTNGRLALSWSFTSQLSYRINDVKDRFNWDQVPWPHLAGQKPTTSFWHSAWVINAKGKQIPEAFNWMHFISGPEGTVPGVELGWELPIFGELDPLYNKRIAEWKKNILPALEGWDYSQSRHYYHHPRYGEIWRSFIRPAIDDIMIGKRRADQAMKEIKPDVDKLLKEGAALM